MLNGKLDILDRLTGDKMIIGYDLGNRFSQISYCSYTENIPHTVSTVAGSENYNIPTVLCKRKGVNQWFYGKEAYKYAEEGGTLVDNLLELAKAGEPVFIEEEEFDPAALLALFMKRSLGLLSTVTSLDKIGALMLTCESLEPRMVEVLSRAAAGLGLKTKTICLQGHVESFYYYTLYQQEELWRQQVVVFTCQEDCMKAYRMECNKKTTPIVAFIDEEEYPFRNAAGLQDSEHIRQELYRQMDESFLRIAAEVCGQRLITSVYLIGDGFQEEWLKESLRYLCKNRRVFQGSNLYSKGAVFGMKEKLCPSETGKKHVFLGNEKLKANIGMKVLRRGIDSYFALLDAGLNWYEAAKECDFLLESGNCFSIIVTHLTGKDNKNVKICLDGLTERTETMTRLSMHTEMTGPDTVQVQVKDMGFGEIIPSSGRIWTENFEV